MAANTYCRSLLDRFADPFDCGFVWFVSHPVGEAHGQEAEALFAEAANNANGASVALDFGGLLQRLCLHDYQDFMPNPVARGLEVMTTPTRDHWPGVEARFLFALGLSMERSVQQMVAEDLERAIREASTPQMRQQCIEREAFYHQYYLRYLQQSINRIMEGDFNDDNAQHMLELPLTFLQHVWRTQDSAEIASAQAFWAEKDAKDAKRVQRSPKEKLKDKKSTNNIRNWERKEFNKALLSGKAEYWKNSSVSAIVGDGDE